MTDERLAEIEKIVAKMRKDCKTWNSEHIYGEQLLAFDDLIQALREDRGKNTKMREVIAVLNCMIYCGEQHTEKTEAIVNNALGFKSLGG